MQCFPTHKKRKVGVLAVARAHARGGSRISRKGGLKIIFTMGEGTGVRAPPIGGLVRAFLLYLHVA